MTHSKSELRAFFRARRRARSLALGGGVTVCAASEVPAAGVELLPSPTSAPAPTGCSATAPSGTPETPATAPSGTPQTPATAPSGTPAIPTSTELEAGLCTQWENACLFFGISPWEPSTLPALFIPTPHEPPIDKLLTRSPRCLLPVLFEGDAPLPWPAWGSSRGGQDLVSSSPPWPAQPVHTESRDALASADIILVPALAVDEDGVRLGQGGGWYDRALLDAGQGVPVVAAVFDDEFLPGGALPLEPHDRVVDAVITPTRFILLPVHG